MALFDSRFIVMVSVVFLLGAALFADGVNSVPMH